MIGGYDLKLEPDACKECVKAGPDLRETGCCVNCHCGDLVSSFSQTFAIISDNYARSNLEGSLRIVNMSIVPEYIQEAGQKPASHCRMCGHLWIQQLRVFFAVYAHLVNEDLWGCQTVSQKLLVSQPDHDFRKSLISIRLGCQSAKGPDSRPFGIQLVDVQRDREILDEVDLVHDVDAVAEALHAQDVLTHLSSWMAGSH